ncbi:SpoIIE family protein phosphatase [Streptomyces sp. Vc74B-19]|uniref:ATP-binding SpoIIE family protein phosphatase n=1 Tax=unclassified Streptomyces TaxID=2593676 RepID=UPI001BFC23E3|nr:MULTISPECIES: ATP-binding SpoIIE family protein phosphatase [unclassified Streptomyces]MBT3165261.1 SpoIIE family protein phosphatase [Streptomyces sp. Vc74B-19]
MRAIPTQRETTSCAPDVRGCTRVEATLSGSPLAPGSARALLRKTLTEWAQLSPPGADLLTGRVGDDAALVASELVTNAVVHAGTEVHLTCRLEEDTGALVVEVADHHPARAPQDGAPEAPAHDTPEYGRGLRLVAALAESWGITYRPGTKTVWARLANHDDAAGDPAETYAGERDPARDLRAAAHLASNPLAVRGRTGPRDGTRDAWRAASYGDDWLARRPGRDGTWLGRGALSFLAEASDLLAGQLDEDLVASLTGQLIVPRLADWCAVWLEDETTALGGRPGGTRAGGRLARVWHAGEQYVEELSRVLEGNPPPHPDDPLGTGPVPYPWPAPAAVAYADLAAAGQDLAPVGPASGSVDREPGAAGAGSGPAYADSGPAYADSGSVGTGPGPAYAGPGSAYAGPGSVGVGPGSAGGGSGSVGEGSGSAGAERGPADGERGSVGAGAGPAYAGPGSAYAGPGSGEGTGAAEGTVSAPPGTALAYRLVAGGRPLGTLVIGRGGIDRFPDEITGLVEDLGRRVALAIGAARQYARQATISAVLQRGLLPGAVAEIPGVRSALVHEPCDKGGPSGDFYDLFPAGRGRWCFAVGDVQGKGPEAAVVIGLVRPWLRLLAREGYRVADVLDRLNQLLLDDATEAADAAARALVAAGARPTAPGDGPQTRFLSLLYGELVPFDGGVRCTLASAGHPLPLLLDPEGAVRTVAQPQTLLGVVEDATYTSETFEMYSGDSLLCVTDGVTERRSGSRQFDDGDGLATALAGCAGMEAGAIAERITRLVHDFGARPPADDLALLVLQAE